MRILLLLISLSSFTGMVWAQAPGSSISAPITGKIWEQAPNPLPLNPQTRRISYRAVVPVAGVSQADLVARAVAWAKQVSTPETPASITNGTDAKTLVVAFGSQSFAYTFPLIESKRKPLPQQTYQHLMRYTVKLSLEEDRYQYEITDFAFKISVPPNEWDPAEGPLLKGMDMTAQGAVVSRAMYQRFVEVAAKLQNDLKDGMSKLQ